MLLGHKKSTDIWGVYVCCEKTYVSIYIYDKFGLLHQLEQLHSSWHRGLVLATPLQPMLVKWGSFWNLMCSRSTLSTRLPQQAFIRHHLSWGVHFCNNLYTPTVSCNASLPKPLSPTDSNEMALHNAARKAGLTFDCAISYLEIPICTGYDDDGTPNVELKGWPLLLPSDMEPWTYSSISSTLS